MIVLLGDTHLPRGSRRLPPTCVELLRGSSLIVHTGDFTGLDALEEIAALGRLAAVCGNADSSDVRSRLPVQAVVEHGGIRIGVVHDAGRRAGRHERLRDWFPDCDLVAYGHSHQPEVSRVDGCWIVNPGSPTERRRASARTVAVLDGPVPVLVDV